MEVLWLIKGLGTGGAEHLLVATAQHADRDRHHFSVVYVLGWKNALEQPLRDEGVRVRTLNVRRTLDLRWVVRLRRHLRNHRYDVIHVHSPLVAAVTRLIGLTLRSAPPTISTEHNTWPSYVPITRMLNRWTFKLDEAHIAVSRAVLESLPASLQPTVEVVVHGVDIDAIDAARSERDAVRTEIGLRSEQIAVCTVANLRRQKDYPNLLTAAKQVIDADKSVVFLAVGHGPLEGEIHALHRQLDLGDRFRFLGYRPDAFRILAGSDVFALGSMHEGYPIAVMEALAAGLPVVATDAGAVPDAVRIGVEGFVVPSRDPEALAEALLGVIRDPELRSQMAGAAAARGREFSIGPAVDRTQAIYDEVAERM